MDLKTKILNWWTAKEKYPLVTLLHCADDEATYVLEREQASSKPV